MPLLWPNLRISQVFGANTDVGKTLLTTALVRGSAAKYANEETNEAGPSRRVFYLKPVSTGPEEESDVSYIERNAGKYRERISTRNLYQYREPMSPHLAAKLAPDLPFPKSNDTLVRGVEEYAHKCHSDLKGKKGALYVETAGGVHSPALHPPHTQSSCLQKLRLPSILIASPHLGGISTTLTSYESLLLRGYQISAVICLNDDYYRNHEFLSEYFRERDIRFFTLPKPPEKNGTMEEDGKRLDQWYTSLERTGGLVEEAVDHLDVDHMNRIRELESMPERTLDSVWWPFTQHGLVNKKEDVMVIDSAIGDNFDAFYTNSTSSSSSSTPPTTAQESLLRPYFDGSASWFTQSHGHASIDLTLAAGSAAGRYGHVLFPSGTHKPALELAEKLKDTVGKGWADRVFYSDNGSTGTEVALKMAIRAAGRRYGWEGNDGEEIVVIGLKGGYHGDTIGSMDASEASTYNTAVDWYKGRGYWFSPPVVNFINGRPTISTLENDWPALPPSLASSSAQTPEGWRSSFSSLQDIYNLSYRSQSPLADYYRDYVRSTLEKQVEGGKRFGAVMMEPTCLGAGGMLFVDPLFQACLIEVVRASTDLFSGSGVVEQQYQAELVSLGNRKAEEWEGLPIIYDEVFSGLNRFGYLSASNVLSHTPDISVYAKILTGGLLPLSATLASKSIFEAFLSDKKVDALLHGHSYTAHPIGCSVALKAIEITEKYERENGWKGEKREWGVDMPEIGNTGKEGLNGKGRWSLWSEGFVKSLSEAEGVKGCMAMGTVLAIELDDKEGGYSSHVALDFLNRLKKRQITSPNNEFEPFQIHSRPLGNVVYLMTSLFTKGEVTRAMERTIQEELRTLRSRFP